jgi:ABC-type lipoprotein release transport system permease subunit
MHIFRLILKEMLHRWVNFLFSLSGVVAAVALLVFFLTTGAASKRETTRLMRDMGFNLRIVSRETEMNRFWAEGFSDHTMPEEYVHRFAEHEGLSYNHLLAQVKRRITWRGKEVLLIGFDAEVAPPDKKKSPMIFSIEPGTVYLGYELGKSEGIKKGDEVEILGRAFRAAQPLSESGSEDDITFYMHLSDAQGLLSMEGRINEIKALECLCRDPDLKSIDRLREQLAALIPEAKVIQMKKIATARERQRLMLEEYFALSLPFLLVVCAAWIATLAMMNVRQRRQETGILRALGYGSGRIAGLFLGKAVFIGVIGAGLGFAIGTVLALWFGPEVFEVTAKAIAPAYDLLAETMAAAGLFAALASLVPAWVAVAQDPAVTLREE